MGIEKNQRFSRREDGRGRRKNAKNRSRTNRRTTSEQKNAKAGRSRTEAIIRIDSNEEKNQFLRICKENWTQRKKKQRQRFLRLRKNDTFIILSLSRRRKQDPLTF